MLITYSKYGVKEYIFQALILGTFATAAIYLRGYLFNFDSLIGSSVLAPMALNPCIALCVLSVGLLFVYPDKGFMRPILSKKLGSKMARKRVAMTFSDNRLGIDLIRYKESLFGMYKTFHQHPDSTGVGLFLTKNQADSPGGSILVDSEVNVGTTFTIYFKRKNLYNVSLSGFSGLTLLYPQRNVEIV